MMYAYTNVAVQLPAFIFFFVVMEYEGHWHWKGRTNVSLPSLSEIFLHERTILILMCFLYLYLMLDYYELSRQVSNGGGGASSFRLRELFVSTSR